MRVAYAAYLKRAARAAKSTVRSLTIGQKLFLSFALFSLPLLLVGGALTKERELTMSTARTERIGLRYLLVLSEVRFRLLQELRAHQFGAASEAGLSSAIRALRAAERDYGAGLGAHDSVERAITAMEVVGASERGRQTAGQAALLALDEASHRVADRSRLLSDPAHGSHATIEILIEAAPGITGAARALSESLSAAFADRRLSEFERATVSHAINSLGEASNRLSEELDEIRETGLLVPEARALAVLANAAALREAAAAFGKSGRLDSYDLVAREGGVQATLSAMMSEIHGNVDTMLAARERELEQAQLSELARAVLLFVFILGLVAAIVRFGVIAPLEDLTATVRSIATGRYDVEISGLRRSDEIGDLARSLAVLRDAAEGLIRADAARAAAESASNAKSHFVATMSHELRTPLNAIIGYAELLAEDAADRGDEECEKDLGRLKAAGLQLLTLINDVLDLSKIEAGRIDITPELCNPVQVIQGVIETASPLAAKNGNVITTDIDHVSEAFVDEQRLKQCLLNLLSNACKFTKDGLVHVSMTAQAENGVSQLVFQVSDTGIGLSEQQIGRLFQPFQQGDANITREYGGTGLGLMITKRMAELMGGDVSVQSTLGAGATFTLKVQQYFEGETAEGAPGEAPEQALALIIDDEPDARELVARALAGVGFAARAARTAKAGLALARSIRPSVIVLDLALPDASGFSIMTELSKIAPVVVLSIDEDRRRSIELGAAEHLVKPTPRDRLCATVLRIARMQDAAPAVEAEAANPVAGRLSAAQT